MENIKPEIIINKDNDGRDDKFLMVVGMFSPIIIGVFYLFGMLGNAMVIPFFLIVLIIPMTISSIFAISKSIMLIRKSLTYLLAWALLVLNLAVLVFLYSFIRS